MSGLRRREKQGKYDEGRGFRAHAAPHPRVKEKEKESRQAARDPCSGRAEAWPARLAAGHERPFDDFFISFLF